MASITSGQTKRKMLFLETNQTLRLVQSLRHGACLRLAITLAVVFYALDCPCARAQDSIEQKLKAAYLINIMSFVRWENDKDEAVICMTKESPVSAYVLAEDGRVLGNKTTLRTTTSWQDWEQCDVFYWDDDSGVHPPASALENHRKSVLTVSDCKGALEDGFAVQFYMRNLKLRFAMNKDVIKTADYRISSKLLRLSRQVD